MYDFEYHAPPNLLDALSVLEGNPDAQILAGGTDLLVLVKDLLIRPSHIVSLAKLVELSGIQRRNDGYFVGSMTPLWVLDRSPEIQRMYPALHRAIQGLAVPSIRNQATFGGNICLDTKCRYYNQSRVWERNLTNCIKAGGDVCHFAPSRKQCYGNLVADTIGPLWLYDASVTLRSHVRERRIPIQGLFTGDGVAPHDLTRGEVLTSIHLPPREPKSGTAGFRLSRRRALDFSSLNVAAAIGIDADDRIRAARLVVTAIGPMPIEPKESLEPLIGAKATGTLWARTAEQAAAETMDVAWSPRLTRHIQNVLTVSVSRVFREAFERAKCDCTEMWQS